MKRGFIGWRDRGLDFNVYNTVDGDGCLLLLLRVFSEFVSAGLAWFPGVNFGQLGDAHPCSWSACAPRAAAWMKSVVRQSCWKCVSFRYPPGVASEDACDLAQGGTLPKFFHYKILVTTRPDGSQNRPVCHLQHSSQRPIQPSAILQHRDICKVCTCFPMHHL